MTRWRWKLLQLSRKLWVRASLLGLVGLAAAVSSIYIERYVPWDFPLEISASAVESLLTIIASSMLAVTTFSLSTMLSAFGAATNSVSPRATPLLLEDRLAQNVLSSFVGSFIFSIVGIVVLKTGAYGERGRFILFLVTIAVIVMIVVMLLRWINHLLLLGRMGETTGRIEAAAARALEERLAAPYLGGLPLDEREREPPEAAVIHRAQDAGYLQHVDLPALQSLAGAAGVRLRLPINPGKFVFPGTVLCWHERPQEAEIDADALRDAFSIGVARGFDQDPRFGVAVLAEVGSGALAPSRSDGATAIDILGRLGRLMTLWGEGALARQAAEPEPIYPNLLVRPLSDKDLFEDAFMIIGRDGAGMIEVQIRLAKVLDALSRIGSEEFRAAARYHAELSAARAAECLSLPQDRERLARALED